MTEDRDLRAVLPDPPPPRPDRRTMAIDEALRRFDGGEEERRAPAGAPAGVSFRAILAQPRIAAFATVVLVALLSLPLWFSDGDRFVRAGQQPTTTGAEQAPVPETTVAAREAVEPAREPPGLAANEASNGGEPAPPPPPAEAPADSPESEAPAQRAAARSPSPAARPDRLPADGPAAAGQAAGQVFALAPPPPPPAPAAPASDSSQAVVVTGARAASPSRRQSAALADRRRIAEVAAAKASDWNACTIDDPRRDVRACGDLADLAEAGPAGRAKAHLADGLRFAWQGDLERAIGAFDKAIALAPDSSLAYLNRGLARWRTGDTGGALTDLDKAIAADPESARGYYHRGRLHRARGEIERAEADARRAVALDPRYEAALP